MPMHRHKEERRKEKGTKASGIDVCIARTWRFELGRNSWICRTCGWQRLGNLTLGHLSIIIIYLATTTYQILQRQHRYSQLRSDSAPDGFPLSSTLFATIRPLLEKTVALIRLEITGSQGYPILGSPKDSPARYRPDPPRRSFPWQARRPPQEP